MRALALAETIRTVSPSAISRQTSAAQHYGALEGALLFCGISAVLAALAVVFNALTMPSALLF